MTYGKILNELNEIMKLLNKEEYDKVKVRLQKCIDDIDERKKSDVAKTLDTRKNSKRLTLLHRVSNNLYAARKRGDKELIEKYESEMKHIKETVFD